MKQQYTQNNIQHSQSIEQVAFNSPQLRKSQASPDNPRKCKVQKIPGDTDDVLR